MPGFYIILTPLLISVILPVVFSLFWFFKIRGEKKIASENVIRTRPSKTLSGFFLGFALIALAGEITLIVFYCITDGEAVNVPIVVSVSIFVAVFSSLCFFAYAYVRFNYVVADADGISVYRLFRKKRYYGYEEIGSFKDTIYQGIRGGLTGYDKNDKKIFAIEAIHIGSSAVARRLRERGVREKYSGHEQNGQLL